MSRRSAVVLLCLAACATGSNGGDDEQPDARVIDARVADGPDADAPVVDAPIVDAPIVDAPTVDGPSIDAPVPIDAPSIDAPGPVDAAIDAATPIDAPGCVPGTTQRLVNPALDQAPVGTGWTQTLIDPGYPLITSDQITGYPPDTAPNHSWMGGFTDGTDVMEQTVTIPPGTTSLVLRGRRLTLTDETGSTVYDSSTVDLLTSTGALIENALTVSNVTATTGWVSWSKTFAAAHAGQTVRVRFRSTNDFSLVTSFFYDSLALDATIACP